MINFIFSVFGGLTIIGSSLIVFCTFLHKKNFILEKLIIDFKYKLPPPHKKPITYKNNYGINVVKLNTLKTSLSQNDIDIFYNNLESFKNEKVIIFKKEFNKEINNLQRLLSNATPLNLDIVVVHHVIDYLINNNKLNMYIIFYEKIKKLNKKLNSYFL